VASARIYWPVAARLNSYVRRAACSAFCSPNSPTSRAAASFHASLSVSSVLEPLGYAHILLGQPDAAIPKLERARDLEREAIYPGEERVRRIESILQTLDEGRLDQATERLNYWRTETLGALRLIQVAA
jgi:hypothetical protein